jgi:hypothetical protein
MHAANHSHAQQLSESGGCCSGNAIMCLWPATSTKGVQLEGLSGSTLSVRDKLGVCPNSPLPVLVASLPLLGSVAA